MGQIAFNLDNGGMYVYTGSEWRAHMCDCSETMNKRDVSSKDSGTSDKRRENEIKEDNSIWDNVRDWLGLGSNRQK